MLCSVAKHLGSDDSTQEVGRTTRLRLVFASTLLSCYRRFLGALQQNRGQSRLLNLFVNQICKRITGGGGGFYLYRNNTLKNITVSTLLSHLIVSLCNSNFYMFKQEYYVIRIFVVL